MYHWNNNQQHCHTTNKHCGEIQSLKKNLYNYRNFKFKQTKKHLGTNFFKCIFHFTSVCVWFTTLSSFNKPKSSTAYLMFSLVMTQWAEKGNVLFCVQAKELKKGGKKLVTAKLYILLWIKARTTKCWEKTVTSFSKVKSISLLSSS